MKCSNDQNINTKQNVYINIYKTITVIVVFQAYEQYAYYNYIVMK